MAVEIAHNPSETNPLAKEQTRKILRVPQKYIEAVGRSTYGHLFHHLCSGLFVHPWWREVGMARWPFLFWPPESGSMNHCGLCAWRSHAICVSTECNFSSKHEGVALFTERWSIDVWTDIIEIWHTYQPMPILYNHTILFPYIWNYIVEICPPKRCLITFAKGCTIKIYHVKCPLKFYMTYK